MLLYIENLPERDPVLRRLSPAQTWQEIDLLNLKPNRKQKRKSRSIKHQPASRK